MKRCHAVLTAVLFFLLPIGIFAAENLPEAARELARQTAALAGKGETVSILWRNLSTLGSSELAQARSAFEDALGETGVRVAEATSGGEMRVTLSENASQYLLVEEARKGEDRVVWIAAWKRSGGVPAVLSGVSLQKKLLWEQDEQILDIRFPAGDMLVLSPSKLVLYARQNGPWAPRQTLLLAPAKPWPRDVRGLLRVTGSAFQAFLPGMTCGGAVEPALTMDCRAGDEPWVLESGSHALMLGNFAAAGNYFDGRVATQTGRRKTVAPFFSAASAEEQGRTLWLLAMVDGSTGVFDASMETLGTITNWGSDLAGTEARCGGGAQVLATRPGDGGEPDAVQAFAIVNRSAAPLGASVDFPGPVTALWPAGGTSAVAVARDPATGKYGAYVITVVCGS